MPVAEVAVRRETLAARLRHRSCHRLRVNARRKGHRWLAPTRGAARRGAAQRSAPSAGQTSKITAQIAISSRFRREVFRESSTRDTNAPESQNKQIMANKSRIVPMQMFTLLFRCDGHRAVALLALQHLHLKSRAHQKKSHSTNSVAESFFKKKKKEKEKK